MSAFEAHASAHLVEDYSSMLPNAISGEALRHEPRAEHSRMTLVGSGARLRAPVSAELAPVWNSWKRKINHGSMNIIVFQCATTRQARFTATAKQADES